MYNSRKYQKQKVHSYENFLEETLSSALKKPLFLKQNALEGTKLTY